jgi:hypothetical protein
MVGSEVMGVHFGDITHPSQRSVPHFPRSIACSEDGDHILIGDMEGRVLLYDRFGMFAQFVTCGMQPNTIITSVVWSKCARHCFLECGNSCIAHRHIQLSCTSPDVPNSSRATAIPPSARKGSRGSGTRPLVDCRVIRRFHNFNSASSVLESHAITVDHDGKIFAVDQSEHRVKVLSGDGLLNNVWGMLGSKIGAFTSPRGIAVSPSDSEVFVADTCNHRIQVRSLFSLMLFCECCFELVWTDPLVLVLKPF